jgi:enamine deaminase RidA (YjgF/YER057c/UK114 family)
MLTKLLDVDGLYSDVPYSYAAIAPPGSMVFTAGACPLDAHGRVVAPGDIGAQMRQALSNLLVTLDAAACEPDDVVKTTVYVATTERGDLLQAWRETEEVFGNDGPPGTLVGVTVLGWPGQLVEIEAVAARRS